MTTANNGRPQRLSFRHWLQYNLFGPSTKHLQLEIFLVVGLELLTISSLKGLYKDDFLAIKQPSVSGGDGGGGGSITTLILPWWDVLFLVLHTLWLSKYWILRLICLWDGGSTVGRTPSWRGWTTLFVTSHVTGGQVFDRLAPRALAKHALSSNNNNNNSLRTRGDNDPEIYLSWVPNVFTYGLWQLWRVNVWLPWLRFWHGQVWDQEQDDEHEENQRRGSGLVNSLLMLLCFPSRLLPLFNRSAASSSSATTSGNNRKSASWWQEPSSSSLWPTVRQYALLIWSKYAPTLQFLLPNLFTYIILYPIAARLRNFLWHSNQVDSLQQQSPSALYNSGFSAHLKSEEARLKRYGSYVPSSAWAVSLHDLAWFVVGLSLFTLGVSMFSRILPPLPDLVAGNNVAKDLRQDAAAAARNANNKSGGGGSGGGGKGSHSRQKSSSYYSSSSSSWWGWLVGYYPSSSNSGSASGSSSETAGGSGEDVWTERHNPIRTEHRLRVHRHVLLWRLLDIWLCCGWLPRSDVLARATGHVSLAPPPHVLAVDLYPTGVTQPYRPEHSHWQHQLLGVPQPYTGGKQLRHTTSLIWLVWNLAVMPVLLLAVQMLYLNRTYFSIGSYFATEWTLIGPVVDAAALPQSLAVWDGRKKYKKDDWVSYHGYLYQAAHNHPEGRPLEPDLMDLQEAALLYELGPPATSQLMTTAFAVQLTSTLLQAVWWLGAFFYQDQTPSGLLWAVAANLVASYALSLVGATPCDELSAIHNAILGRRRRRTKTAVS